MYLTQGLHRSLQQTPERIATIFRGRRRTFRELGDRVARLAAALCAAGMARGDRVGILALNSDRYLEYAMGVWWGGGVLNPVNTRWSVPEIAYSLDDCDNRILIVDDHFLDVVSGICSAVRIPPVLIHAGDGDAPEGMLSFEMLIADTAPMQDAGRGGSDLACIMYTGGTTGFPKGVMQTHMNIWSSSIMRMAESAPLANSAVLHAAPFFHVAGLGRAIIQFLAGETHVILPAFDAGDLLKAISEEKVGETLLVPTMIQAVLDHPDFAATDLTSLKRLVYGASPMPERLLGRVVESLPGVELAHSYGMTEACPSISANPGANHGEAGRKSGLYRSVGRGLPGLMVKVVDGDGQEVPRGTVGEIVVRGPNVMAGYWNKPEETAQALRGGWLHTGDGAYMDENGYLYIVDRLKDMIISGGENVYSAEVEGVIARHPSVAACAVIGVPHATWGEAVHAVVVRQPDAVLAEEDVKAHCRLFIAGYKCPKTVEFRPHLPLSSAGKVLKRELRAPHWPDKQHGVAAAIQPAR
ncbi:long-chain fatty acid--CoA ligase [Caballeronia choica]|jgi:long-chain acyl-CoA synthetase|uniref:Long-chain fatty acid--CoA ligase n=1 Tax=Caballeronia choica TaxID=326476 RepID=A0A158KUP7_9BURK|nr:long-chain fatty acid--CoA ligase [Caballeronia choica]SAL84161.1 long-chain fatty acid--CoA ligase [Caballeronia choica]